MKGAMIFICGFLTGSLATLFYVKKRVIPALKEELEKEYERDAAGDILEASAAADSYTDEEQILTDTGAPTSGKVSVKTAPNGVQTVKVDYTMYSKDERVDVPDPGKVPQVVVEQPAEELPYVIDANSYDEYSDYTAHCFVIYSDGVVIDDDTEEILDADPMEVFGETAMIQLNNADDNMVYVRDDTKKTDYCLERRDYPFDGPEHYEPGDGWD